MHLIEVGSTQKSESSILNRVDLATLIEWARLFLLTTAFVFLTASKIFESNYYNPKLWIPLYGLFALSFAAHFLFILFFHRTEYRKIFFGITASMDAILIGGCLALYGQAHSVILLAFLCNIAFIGSYLGLYGALSLAFFSAALFNSIISLNFDFAATNWSQLVTLYNGSFFASAIVAGLFQVELSRVTETIEIQKEDIKSLQDINQLIIENVGSGLIVTDMKNKITKANRAASRILADISLIGKDLIDVLPGSQKELNALEHREGVTTRFEFGHLNYEGSKMVLEMIATPLMRRPYGFQGHIILLQNLTEVKNFEETIRQQEKMAAIGSMAAGIAHEIRNPLASISGSIQLIASTLKPESEDDRKLTNIIVKEIDRLNRLIAEFLEFVRPPMKVDDPVKVNEVIGEVLQIIKANPQVPKTLQIEIQLNAKGLVSGHFDKLKQAFLNIIINASHAVEKKVDSVIKIVTYDDGDSVIVKVHDNGIGMSRDTVSRIFVPFFTTKSKGTGLGLAITHKIFEAHEAAVRVESELNQGTTFIIEFKRRRD
jgi:two-component system sensor histidine kinase PilS (NtrC family)